MVIGQVWCIPVMLWLSSHTVMMCCQALWNGDQSNVVYPCDAVAQFSYRYDVLPGTVEW